MRSFLFAIGVLGGVIPILGQEPPLVDTGNVAVEETIVVTASLKEEARNSLPSTVDVIGSEEIEARQSTFVAGLIGTLPGMTVVRSGSSGAVTSLFTRGTNSNQTLVLWNGIATFPDYPSEIRTLEATLPGVSAFQVLFSSGDVFTPGDTHPPERSVDGG